jgi:uncharacterized protein Smg (DUF494 family)
MRRLLDYAVLAALALLAAACTLTQLAYSNIALAYNNAPPMLSWMVADYVDMSEQQKEFVRERFDRAFAWHRQQQLPEYRRFLEKVLVQAEDNITVEEAAAAHRELRTYYHRAVERLLPDMADFLLGLDSVQVKQMERRFAKDNRKMVSDATEQTGEERLDKRVERFTTHLEQFVGGSLTEEQRRMVVGYVSAQPELVDERLADRRFRQERILGVVRDKPPRDEAIAALRRIFIDTEGWRNPGYLTRLRQRDQAMFDLISRLSGSLNPDQRAAFQKRVRGFMRDITEISAAKAG